VLEQVAQGTWLPIRAGCTYPARVEQVRDGGNSPLQSDKLILSLGPKMTLPTVRVGDVLQLAMATRPNLAGVTTAIGAGRILMTGGRMPDLGPANQPRHPRSMLGWNEKYLYFIVVDGRHACSIGMTYPEMAALVKQYGCSAGAELDGGGSSTLWALGKILNSPSDGRPRAIANGLILFRRQAPASIRSVR
jgi:Phosphodiester glycosidase